MIRKWLVAVILLAMCNSGVAQQGEDYAKWSQFLLFYNNAEQSGLVRVVRGAPNVLRWREHGSGLGEVTLVLPFEYAAGITHISGDTYYLVAGISPSTKEAKIVFVQLDRGAAPNKITILQTCVYSGLNYVDPAKICYNVNEKTIYLLAKEGEIRTASWENGAPLPLGFKKTNISIGATLKKSKVSDIDLGVPSDGSFGVLVSGHFPPIVHFYWLNGEWVSKQYRQKIENKWHLKEEQVESGAIKLQISGGEGGFFVIDSRNKVVGSGVSRSPLDVVELSTKMPLALGELYKIVGGHNTSDSGWFYLTQRFGVPGFSGVYGLTRGIIYNPGFFIGSKNGALAFRLRLNGENPSSCDRHFSVYLWFNVIGPNSREKDYIHILNPESPENRRIALLGDPKFAWISKACLKAGNKMVGGGTVLEIPNAGSLMGCKLFFQFIIIDENQKVYCTDVFGTMVLGLSGEKPEFFKPEMSKAWEAISSTKWYIESNAEAGVLGINRGDIIEKLKNSYKDY